MLGLKPLNIGRIARTAAAVADVIELAPPAPARVGNSDLAVRNGETIRPQVTVVDDGDKQVLTVAGKVHDGVVAVSPLAAKREVADTRVDVDHLLRAIVHRYAQEKGFHAMMMAVHQAQKDVARSDHAAALRSGWIV